MIPDRNLDSTPGQHGDNEQDAPREPDILDIIAEETAQMITDDHIENRLRETLRTVAFGPVANYAVPSFTGPDLDHAAEAWRAVLRAQRDLHATRQEAAQIITEARAAADKAHDEADAALTHAAQIIRDAREQAQQIISDAEDRAGQIISDAHRESEQTQRVQANAVHCWRVPPGDYDIEVRAGQVKEQQGSGSHHLPEFSARRSYLAKLLQSRLTGSFGIADLLWERMADDFAVSFSEILKKVSRRRQTETFDLLLSRIIHDSGQPLTAHFSEIAKLPNNWQPDNSSIPARRIIPVKSSRPRLRVKDDLWFGPAADWIGLTAAETAAPSLIAPASTFTVWGQGAFSQVGQISVAHWRDPATSVTHNVTWQENGSYRAFATKILSDTTAAKYLRGRLRETALPACAVCFIVVVDDFAANPTPDWIPPLPPETGRMVVVTSSPDNDHADNLDSTYTYVEKEGMIIVAGSKDIGTSHSVTPDVFFLTPDHGSEEEPPGISSAPVMQH
jgi:vacuolar-type H+-ATPase subunit H